MTQMTMLELRDREARFLVALEAELQKYLPQNDDYAQGMAMAYQHAQTMDRANSGDLHTIEVES